MKESTKYGKRSLGSNWPKLLTLLVFSIFITSIIAQNTNATWWNDTFEFRKEINITNLGSTELTDFPAYINVSAETEMQADYDDIRFIDGTCDSGITTQLTYEREYYDANHAVFWVKIPTLNITTETICMYYGNAVVTTTQNVNSVWKTNYKDVIHMNSTGVDSTSNGNNKVGNVGTPTADNTYLGYGQKFSGTDAWSMTDVSYWEAAWYDRSHEVVFDTGADITTRQTLFAEGGASNGILMYLRSGSLYARWWSESQGWSGDFISATVNTNTIYHATMEFENIGGGNYNYSLFLNGVKAGEKTTTAYMNAHSGNGGIGNTGTNSKDFHDILNVNGQYFVGSIYELRLYDLAESEDWILMSAQNMINHSNTNTYGTQEGVSNRIGVTINTPPTAAIYTTGANKTFNYNISINCLTSVASCGTVTAQIKYATASTFSNIATSSTTPVWTSNTNPQNCVLNGGQSCTLQWTVNSTGNVGDKYNLVANLTSSLSGVDYNITENLTVEIVSTHAIIFNQTSITIPTFTRDSGNGSINASVFATLGNNTGINVACKSGNCDKISNSWTNGTNLNENVSQDIKFTCDDSQYGDYSTTFAVTSNEDGIDNDIVVSCTVLPVYGPINISFVTPTLATIFNISHDRIFTINASVECNGLCGNLSAYVINGNGYDPTWFNSTFSKRIHLNITNVGTTTLTNFPMLINVTKTVDMNSDYSDLRFVDKACNVLGGTEMDYEIDSYDGTRALVWVRVPTFATGTNEICMYYSNTTTIVSGENISGVWDSQYDAVWHFGETGTNDRLDSTGNSYDGMPVNYDSDERTASPLGYSDKFDGTNDALAIRTLSFGSASIDQLSSCTWFKSTFSGAAYNNNWAFLDFDRSESFNYYLEGDGSIGFSTDGGPTHDQSSAINGYNDGSWHQACVVYDGVDKIIYVDGAETDRAVNAHSGTNLGTTNTRFGYIGDGSEAGSFNGGGNNIFYQGEMDDVWLSLDTKSSDWINQTYQMVVNQSTYVSFGTEENDVGGNSVSKITGDQPFFTTSGNPQSCIPTEDGSCSFEWTLNTSGIPNIEIYNLTLVVISNISQISANQSNTLEVNITNIYPTVNLTTPQDGYKIVTDGNFTFKWNITDPDDSTHTCTLYINDIEITNTTCYNYTENSITYLNTPFGINNWTIQATDSENATTNSTTNTFNAIKKLWQKVSKSITSLLIDNTYLVKTHIENTLNYSQDLMPLDFTDEKMNAGSWTPSYDFLNITYINPYLGKYYAWNLTITALTTNEVNYSMTSVGGEYNLSENYVIGLE